MDRTSISSIQGDHRTISNLREHYGNHLFAQQVAKHLSRIGQLKRFDCFKQSTFCIALEKQKLHFYHKKTASVDLPQRKPNACGLAVHGLAVLSHGAAFASIHSPGPSVSSLSKCCLQPVGSKNTWHIRRFFVVLWWPGHEKSSDAWSQEWLNIIHMCYIYIYTHFYQYSNDPFPVWIKLPKHQRIEIQKILESDYSGTKCGLLMSSVDPEIHIFAWAENKTCYIPLYWYWLVIRNPYSSLSNLGSIT